MVFGQEEAITAGLSAGESSNKNNPHKTDLKTFGLIEN